MKAKITGILLFLAVSSMAMASTPSSQEYGFKFTLKSKVLELKIKAADEKSAFEMAAQECFNYYSGAKNRDKIRLPADTGMDIIDTCANPRSI